MKTNILLIGAIVLACASCSNDEIREVNPGNIIEFRTALDTRAAETTEENLENFFVTAFDKRGDTYFKNVEFTPEGSIWTATDRHYYWPADKELTFYAWSPSSSDLGGTMTIDATEKTLKGFSPSAAIADQKDFITAVTTAAWSANGTMLEFSHNLAQIQIMAKNGNDGHIYKIKGIKIAQVASEGDYDFETGEWAPGDTKATYIDTYETPVILDAEEQSIMNSSSGNAMLIPQQLTGWDSINDKTNENKNSYISVYLNIQTSEGMPIYPEVDGSEDEPYGWVAVAIDTKWEQGYRYIYHLDFTAGAGSIDPDEEGAGESVLGDTFKFQVDGISQWGAATDSKPEV